MPQPAGVESKLAFDDLAIQAAKTRTPYTRPGAGVADFRAGLGRGRRARPGPRKGTHHV